MHIGTDVFASNSVPDVSHVEPLVNSHGHTDEMSAVEEGREEL